MVDVDSVVKETKRNLKKYNEEIAGAERLVKLLERSGLPVTEEKAKIGEMKDQARLVKRALRKDAEENQQQ